MVVYLITNVVNGKKYVGQTKRPLAIRWTQHKADSKRGRNTPLYNAIRKYGVEAFTIEVLTLCDNRDMMDSAEKSYIRLYRTKDRNFGYNLTDGGEGQPGVSPSIQTRAKMRAYKLGRKASPETRALISAIAKADGCIPPSRKGIPHSPEHARKIAESKRRNSGRA